MKDWNKIFTVDEQARLVRRLNAKFESSARRGIECSLTQDDIFMLGTKLLGHGKCDYTDLGFSTVVAGSQGNPEHPKYPTIERIDDTKGYVRGNVCVVMQRANQLKDNFVDKRTATTIIDPIDREIVRAMILNMSKEHMEKLKTKYLPEEETKPTEETNVELDMNIGGNISVAQAEDDVNSNVRIATIAEATGEDLQVIAKQVGFEAPEPEPTPAPVLPEDVAVALAYARYCTDFGNVGMNVSVTYAQFKAKYVRKVCALTGEKLTTEPKALLILDLDIGFAKDNFIVVTNKIGNAVTQMMIATGMSVPQITAMLNKAA